MSLLDLLWLGVGSVLLGVGLVLCARIGGAR